MAAEGRAFTPTNRPRPPWALQLVRDLCDALGFLHGEGLVHRDLKPANIVIRPDGSPVLVDFGLSVGLADEHGRDAPLVHGSRAGTPWFMSPEQVRGDPVDPRTDLYALGCILFQLIAGQPPFPLADALAAMTAHLTKAPPRLESVVPDVEPALSDLVDALLRKRPDQRPGYASDVAAVLESLGAQPPGRPGPRPRTSLYRPGLVGRDDELARMDGLLRVLATYGPGGTVWVRGEGGVGKTRLMSEVLTRAKERSIAVRVARCSPVGTRGLTGLARERPFDPLQAVFQTLLDEARAIGPGAGGPALRQRRVDPRPLCRCPRRLRQPDPRPRPGRRAGSRLRGRDGRPRALHRHRAAAPAL